jgi:hypothetical protein
VPEGDDFPLVAGSFLWIEFGQKNVVDLGTGATASLSFAPGFNAFSYAGFPVDYTAYDLLESLGAGNASALRFFDAFAGLWRAVEIGPEARRIGPNFIIPRVSTILLDMNNPVADWKP